MNEDEEKTTEIRHSYGCVDNRDMIKIKPYKKVDIDISVLGKVMTRKMVIVPLVNKKTGNLEDWYVDMITGTMYDIHTLLGNSCAIHVVKVRVKPKPKPKPKHKEKRCG